MNVDVKKRFISDASKLRSDKLIDELLFLLEHCSEANSTNDIAGFKWMKGYPKMGRIKLGEYRIGVNIEKNLIVFVCLLHRSVIYEQFP